MTFSSTAAGQDLGRASEADLLKVVQLLSYQIDGASRGSRSFALAIERPGIGLRAMSGARAPKADQRISVELDVERQPNKTEASYSRCVLGK